MPDLAAVRHKSLLQHLRDVGAATVEELALQFDVTPQTIRRDLNALAGCRLLFRVRGGAMTDSALDNLSYASRRTIASREKEDIGRAAAALVPDNVSLFINIGTTTEAVARNLIGNRHLMVVTNNLNVAEILADAPEMEVIVAGGKLRAADRAVVGPLTVDFLRSFKVDYAVIGASALDSDGDLLDFDIDEIKVSQSIVSNARRVILVVDSSKFGRPAPARIASLRDIDVLVTDRMDNPELAAACERHGVEVVTTAAAAPKRRP